MTDRDVFIYNQNEEKSIGEKGWTQNTATIFHHLAKQENVSFFVWLVGFCLLF